MHELKCTIAGIAMHIGSDRPVADLGLMERFGDFARNGDAPSHSLDLHWRVGDPDAVPYGELLFDPGSIWRVHARTDGKPGWVVRIQYQPAGGLQAAMIAEPDWSSVEMVERPGGAASLLTFGAGELLLRARVLFADGLVFHASGIDDNGRGIVFVGHSGAGKSTQALMWCKENGVVAMNDDRIAVRLLPGGPMVYGTPWGGTAEIARSHNAPLSAFVVLEQAPENELICVPAEQAAPIILPRTFLPYWDTGLMDRATANLQAILGAAPVYRLRCRPEREVIDLVRSAL